MPVTQVMTFTVTPPAIGDTPDIFESRAIGVWNELKNTTVPNLNTAFGQLNALETNVNNKEALATSSANTAVIAKDTAVAVSGATVWVSGASYIVGAVHWSPLNGMSYRSKTVHSGVVTDPSLDATNWFGLAFEPTIDEKVSHLSVTASTYNTDGTLATMTYTGGYKTLYAYILGVLNTVQYTDTNGVTVLLTETMGYTSGNLTSVTRS